MTSGAAERPGLAEAQGKRPGREEFLIWGVEKQCAVEAKSRAEHP